MDKLFAIFNKKSQFWIFLIILVSLSMLTVVLYGDDFIGGDDYYFHNARFDALMLSLKEGTFPTYIDYKGIYGYGYLTKIFYSDFVLIPFAFIANCTSKIFAYQLLYFTMTLFSGLSMYIFVSRVYKSSYAASISGLLYAFSVYRLFDLYHRAAWGEAFSFTFLPIAFLGLFYIIKGNYKNWYILSIALSLMIMTHLLSTFLLIITFVIILLIYVKSFLKEPIRIYYLILSAVVTLILSSYFIFPFVEQLLSNTFYFQKFKSSAYTTGSFTQSFYEIMMGAFSVFKSGWQLASIGILLVVFLPLRFFISKKVKDSHLRNVDVGVIIGFFYLFLISDFAPWEKFPLYYLSVIQFPWRFYEFIVFFFSIAGGYYLHLVLKHKTCKMIVLEVIFVITLFILVVDSCNYKNIRVVSRQLNTELNEKTHYVNAGMEYFPVKLPYPKPFILDRGDSFTSINGDTYISDFSRNNNILEFQTHQTANESLELPLMFFKGYVATLNGTDIHVSESNRGLVQISTETSGNIEVYYAGTFVQKLSWYLTILTIFVLSVYVCFQRKRLSK